MARRFLGALDVAAVWIYHQGVEPRESHRLERWLVFVADHLRASGAKARLLFGGGGGDLLILTCDFDHGFCELLAMRIDKRIQLTLVADGSSIAQFADALAKLHRTVARLDNAKRKFVHRLERVAENLGATLEARKADYPYEELSKLKQLIPETCPMIGVEGAFPRERVKGVAATTGDRRMVRLLAKYPSRYAALIQTQGGPRAALYEPESKTFEPTGEAATAIEEAIEKHAGAEPSEFALQDRDKGTRWRDHLDWHDVGDVLEWVTDLGRASRRRSCNNDSDCGSLDLPDCDVVDLPDCGGCDCSP